MDSTTNKTEKIYPNQQIQINSESDPRQMQVPSPLTQMRIADQKAAPAEEDIHLSKGIPINTNVPPPKKEEYNTLDEPIKDTLFRDAKRIFYKCQHVLLPNLKGNKLKEIQNWDLWGPLIFALCLCLVISLRPNNAASTSGAFVTIFCFLFFGSIAVALNANFLGVSLGICQACCLLGYCVLPFLIVSIINSFLPNNWLRFIQAILILGAIVWAALASLGLVGSIAQKEKKFVVLFPMVLFYVGLGLFIL